MTEKEKMREDLRTENPEMTDEQFEAEWAMIESLGLVETEGNA